MAEQYREGGMSRSTRSICNPCLEGKHSGCSGTPCECASRSHYVSGLERLPQAEWNEMKEVGKQETSDSKQPRLPISGQNHHSRSLMNKIFTLLIYTIYLPVDLKGRRNDTISSANNPGSSIAAKCPPLGILVHLFTLNQRSAHSRGVGHISFGKIARAV